MSSCHKVARLLVFISSTLCLHVQDEQLLRRRVTLTELDRGHFVQSLHNVERRDTTNSTNPSTPPVLGHFAHLRNDRHRLAIVHWSGENSSAIFILTTNRYRNGTSRESNLWRSIDYGYTFNNDNTKVNTAVLDYYYINPHDKMKLIFVGKIAHVLYITENEGQSYLPVKVPFVADDIDYNPSENRDTYLTAYDKTQKSLYVSTDYGKTWISLGRNITRYYWEVLTGEDDTKLYFEKLHMSGSKVYVVSYPYTSSSIMEFQPDTARPEFDQNVMVLSNEYILSQITDSTGSARLYVSYKRGRFVVARFPLQQQLIEKDYLLVDASEHQVFVAVNHRSNLTSLYMSETKGISYTLTLGDVVTTSDSSWNSNTARVQLYRVRGIKGTYFVNQHQQDRTPWTLVSYDKGGEWVTVPAPSVDNLGIDIHCYQPNCSLQLDLNSMLSRDSTIGIIWAQGNVGRSKTSRNQGSFISRDDGLTWHWVFDAYYIASFADHGAVLASALRNYRITDQVKHSCDEGTTWKSISMDKSIYVIGLLTEPGERSLTISVFGFEKGWVEWLVGQLDFSSIASVPCTPSDYYKWIPTDERIGRRCLLGERLVYKRRKSYKCCYNGYDYETPISSSVCGCAEEDFECDFGYDRRDELDGVCQPSKGTPTQGPPAVCPEGEVYNITRGYRKVAGDLCQGGQELLFMYQTVHCPIDPPGGLVISSDVSVVAPHQVVTFSLSQASGGVLYTKYVWSFDDTTFNSSIGFTNSHVITHTFSKSRKTPYLVTIVAQNTGGQLSAFKPIFVYDKIVNATVSPPKLIVENVTSTFTVQFDTSRNQSYGNVQYRWDPGDNSVAQLTYHPVFSHMYKKAGVYHATVEIYNLFLSAPELKKEYEVKVVSGPGGLSVTAFPDRAASGKTVTFTLNQNVGSTKESTVYKWTFGDGTRIDVTSFSQSHLVTHVYSHSQQLPYEVAVTADTGFASVSTTTYVSIYDQVTSAKIHKPQKIVENENASFSVIPDSSKIYGTIHYLWDMGEGRDPVMTAVPVLTYRYRQGGEFAASVSLNNSLPRVKPFIKKFNVSVESETLVSVKIHAPSTVLAVNHEYSFNVTAKAQVKALSNVSVVDYEGILDCSWDTGGKYDDFLIVGAVIRHSYVTDDLGPRTMTVFCRNANSYTLGKESSIQLTVVAPTKKVKVVDVYGLHELYLANATNDVVAGWTTAVRNEFAKSLGVNPSQLLVTLLVDDDAIEVIVLPQSNSADDVKVAESIAQKLSNYASGTLLSLTVNGDLKELALGQATILDINKKQGNQKMVVGVGVGVGVAALVLVGLLVLFLYIYRRKYGQLEIAYQQLRQTGQGSYEFTGDANTVGEEEDEGHQVKDGHMPMQMSKILDGFD